jgi:hypothetical protein
MIIRQRVKRLDQYGAFSVVGDGHVTLISERPGIVTRIRDLASSALDHLVNRFAFEEGEALIIALRYESHRGNVRLSQITRHPSNLRKQKSSQRYREQQRISHESIPNRRLAAASHS